MLCVTTKTLRVGILLFSQSSNSSPRRFSAVRTSSAENGSSMNRISGSTANARAKPTRCFMPPERSLGYDDSKPCNPTDARLRSALWRRSSGATACANSGTSTLSMTVSQGNSAKFWNTIATCGSASSTGFPCQSTCPLEGFVSPVRIRSSVDLPQPEGPSTAMISPGSMVRFSGAITWTVPPSGRSKSFSTPRASTMGSAAGCWAAGAASGPGGSAASLVDNSSMSCRHASSGSSSKKCIRCPGCMASTIALSSSIGRA
jgi:hypothetical protein